MSDSLNKVLLDGITVEILPSGSTEERDIYNCLLTLYGSREGEQALDREFGINIDCLSYPAEAAEALLTAEIIKKTAKYEKRARVERVDYSGQNSVKGNLQPKVVVSIV